MRMHNLDEGGKIHRAWQQAAAPAPATRPLPRSHRQHIRTRDVPHARKGARTKSFGIQPSKYVSRTHKYGCTHNLQGKDSMRGREDSRNLILCSVVAFGYFAVMSALSFDEPGRGSRGKGGQGQSKAFSRSASSDFTVEPLPLPRKCLGCAAAGAGGEPPARSSWRIRRCQRVRGTARDFTAAPSASRLTAAMAGRARRLAAAGGPQRAAALERPSGLGVQFSDCPKA
jgi:hypothetical protein